MEVLIGRGMFRLVALILGYFLGNVQTAHIAAKKLRGIDIRDFGSGNSGTTNITRLLGIKIGLVVFAIDALKTVLAFVIASMLFGEASFIAGVYAGIGAVLGHNFPFHMGFKGGKGVASTFGLVLCIDFRVALVLVGIGLLCVAIIRMVSVGSLVVTALFPIMLFAVGHDTEVVAVSVFLWGLAWFMHRGNIARIMAGTERKVGRRVSSKVSNKGSSKEAGDGQQNP